MLKLLRGLAARFRSRRERPSLVVEVDADGVTLRIGEDMRSVRWDQVTRVYTCKRDRVMTDEIVLMFEFTGPDGATRALPVSEEWPGFTGVMQVLPERFGISPGWYERVMFPVFNANLTVLYERPASPAQPETA